MNRRDFLRRAAQGTIGFVSVRAFERRASGSAAGARANRPNIVLIMADDMGYSDLGCYGSEIKTPNIDRLAADGLRFAQFYNCAKCAPTRNSLLTGLYYQQTDVGKGENCVTIAEALRRAGYTTLMTGKWHVGSTPIDRGFDRYFGMLGGACSYFEPNDTFRLDATPFKTDDKNFYTTDAFTDYALEFLDEAGRKDKPFFLYVAYNAPHYPLHALPEDIEKYRGTYMKGWDAVRRERYDRLIKMGLVDSRCALSERQNEDIKSGGGGVRAVPPWDSVEDKEAEDLKMAVYAAMVDRMDQNIGRIMRKLKDIEVEDNTLVMFLSDNGGCPYERNHTPDIPPGPAESYRTYDTPWANVSNTPFRLYKRFNHEGGNSTPFVARWPQVIKGGGSITHQPGHIIDVMATCIEVAGAAYPAEYDGRQVLPLEGKSLVPIFEGRRRKGHDALFWEFQNNKAVRQGKWKLVTVGDGPWELYDIETDRTETNNLVADMPEKARELENMWNVWAERCNVKTTKARTGSRERARAKN